MAQKILSPRRNRDFFLRYAEQKNVTALKKLERLEQLSRNNNPTEWEKIEIKTLKNNIAVLLNKIK